MKKTCTEYNDILTHDPNYSNILDQANDISKGSLLTYSIFTNEQLLSYYLQLHPNYDDTSEQDYAISTLLSCNGFSLIDIILKQIKQNP
ncbi:MAG: hypothetical protein MUO21_02150, partial [Nitrososphaeraceae archaeon]|nr:hypothetical protein [Nitrososphaeraceae archaeon]